MQRAVALSSAHDTGNSVVVEAQHSIAFTDLARQQDLLAVCASEPTTSTGSPAVTEKQMIAARLSSTARTSPAVLCSDCRVNSL